ncbi:MAG: septum formation initiator family protein [bacterium]
MNVLLTIITRITVITALVFVVAAGLFLLPPKISQMSHLEHQRNELLRKIDHKNNEIKLLKEKQQRFKADPEFVEHIARQNKRVRPGELVFIFDADDVK